MVMTYFFNTLYIYVDIFIIVFYLPFYCNIRYVVLSFDEIKTHYFFFYEDCLSCAQWFAFSLTYSNNQFRKKCSLNLGLKQKIVDTVKLKHSKQLMHVKCAYVSTWHVVLKVFVRLFRIKQEKASKQGLVGAIQLFQKTLSEEKQKVFKPRPQGNVGCFKSVFCWQM